MNEFGELNMGNPSVQFDEGRERAGHWLLAFQPSSSCLLYMTEKGSSSGMNSFNVYRLLASLMQPWVCEMTPNYMLRRAGAYCKTRTAPK